jgi:hypothetical protein
MRTDLQILGEFVGTVSAVRDGYYPFNPARGYSASDPELFDPDSYAHLRDFYNHQMGLLDAAQDVLFEAYYELQLARMKPLKKATCTEKQSFVTRLKNMCMATT